MDTADNKVDYEKELARRDHEILSLKTTLRVMTGDAATGNVNIAESRNAIVRLYAHVTDKADREYIATMVHAADVVRIADLERKLAAHDREGKLVPGSATKGAGK